MIDFPWLEEDHHSYQDTNARTRLFSSTVYRSLRLWIRGNTLLPLCLFAQDTHMVLQEGSEEEAGERPSAPNG